ncbi:MAG TPA: MarR family transcriptional regulator [Rectinemataceae bacterium]|nr:MarR family transcriptional regulator [Rectinemataceae bacterium]
MSEASSGPTSRERLGEEILTRWMDFFIQMQYGSISNWLMHELSFAQARALIVIAAKKSQTLGQLAILLDVSKATASVLVQHLVDKGLLERRENPQDRRSVDITLSSKGAEIGAGRRGAREGQWRRWLERMTEEELGDLARGLAALARAAGEEDQNL